MMWFIWEIIRGSWNGEVSIKQFCWGVTHDGMDLLSSNDQRIDAVGLSVEYRAVAWANKTGLPMIKEIQSSHPDYP